MTRTEPLLLSESLTTSTTSPTEASLLVAFTRMETKVDVVLTQHGAKLEDHETRLRVVEDRRTVSPAALWTAVTTGAGLVFGAVTLFSNLLNG
jgi:hypothetical protein